MKKLFPFLALLIVFAWGCGKSEKEETQKSETTTDQNIVARVNGRPIYMSDLKGKALKDVIDYEILYEVGLKQGLDKKFEREIEGYKKKLIVNALQKDIRANMPKEEEISEQEIEEYYKQNQDKYKIMSFQKIVVREQNLANEIQKRALAGEDFEKIASDYSKSGTDVKVLDMRFSREYNKLFSGKEIGSVSEVIQQGDKFEIIKLTQVRDIPLARAKQSMKFALKATKNNQAIHDYAEKLKKENNIKVEILEVEETK